jgi:hypothetical protein
VVSAPAAPVKPVIIATPKPLPTQPVAPRPSVPGYVEIGNEKDNPGLPPVGAPETIVGGAQGSRDDRREDGYVPGELPPIDGGKVIQIPVQDIRPKPRPVRPSGGESRDEMIHVTDPKIGPPDPPDPGPAVPYWPPNVTTCEDDNTWLWWLLGGYLVYRHTRRRRHS